MDIFRVNSDGSLVKLKNNASFGRVVSAAGGAIYQVGEYVIHVQAVIHKGKVINKGKSNQKQEDSNIELIVSCEDGKHTPGTNDIKILTEHIVGAIKRSPQAEGLTFGAIGDTVVTSVQGNGITLEDMKKQQKEKDDTKSRDIQEDLAEKGRKRRERMKEIENRKRGLQNAAPMDTGGGNIGTGSPSDSGDSGGGDGDEYLADPEERRRERGQASR